MAQIQHILPDGSYVNETNANQHVTPGGGYADETFVAVVSTSASNQPRFKFYYTALLQPAPRAMKDRQRGAQSTAAPVFAQLPFTDHRRTNYTALRTSVGGAQRQRRSSTQVALPGFPALPYTDRRKIYKMLNTSAGGAHRLRRALAQDMPVIVSISFDNFVRQVLVRGNGVLALDSLMRQVLVKNLAVLVVDGVLRQALVTNPPASAPLPIFPAMSAELQNGLPVGYPVKLRPTMSTIVDINPWSAREVRYAKQPYALWEFDLTFEQLKDQTPNQVAYSLFIGIMQYQQLVQQFLMSYGLAGLFLFDAPWDNSRTDQLLGTGDGSTYTFTATRSWGYGTAQLTEPVGSINQVTNVKVNGVTVNTAHYKVVRNKIIFQSADGTLYPPANGATITMTFSFYYLCRFVNNELDFEMFFKNRWLVKTVTIRSVTAK